MSDAQDEIEIKIHDVTGRTLHVALPRSGLTPEVLGRLNPAKLFAAEFIPIRFENNLTAMPTSAICELELIGTGVPRWPYLMGAIAIVDIPADEFAAQYNGAEYAEKRKKAWDNPGSDQIGFTEYILVNGRRRIWEVRMKSLDMTGSDMSPYINRLLSTDGLHAELRGGGRVIVNPKTIRRMSFYPGPTIPPKGSIVARFISSGRTGG